MLENLELFKMRARAADNDRQHNRMIIDKKRSMHRALLYSYQAAWVKKDNDEEADYVRALMNPDKVKFDYDEKIISIDWEHGFVPGTTFEWGRNTGLHFIIYKQELSELAYFRGNCRRCQYLVARDPETHEEFGQWVAMRGPVETKINTIQKAGIVADVPNLTLNIYMTDTDQNRRTFERYKRFEFDGRFWQVQAPDYISTPGIFQITAEEDYECHNDEMFIRLEDLDHEDLVPDDVNEINGEKIISPLEPHLYSYKFEVPGAEWWISLPASKNKEIDDVLEYKVIGNKLKVTWTGMKSGQFIIHYGETEKTITVSSLF